MKLECLDSSEIQIGETIKVVLQHKYESNRHWIDIRKWSKYNSDDYFATSKGIMMSLENWKAILPTLNSFIDKST